MRSGVHRHGRRWQRSARMRVCGLALTLIAGCVSCRSDTADGPPREQSPNVTGAAPAGVAAGDLPITQRVSQPAAVAGFSASIPAQWTLEAEDAKAATQPAIVAAVNSDPLGGGCEMCHVDVEDELVESVHYTEGVGCVKCHGPSEGHSADENNDVKPDRTYAKEAIDEFCGDCHECSRPRVAAPPTAQQTERAICTQCHDAHSLTLLSKTAEP